MADDWILSPSILSADFSCLGEQIHALEDAGASWIHIDVMDGHFVPNISMGPFIVEACRKITRLPLDVHLMIDTPTRYVADFARAGATRITVHIETDTHIYRTLEVIRGLGCYPGVAVNPGTSGASLTQVFHLVDLVLVLGTNPGFPGQKFIPAMFDKIGEIRGLLNDANSAALIQVDGGMTLETIPLAYAAGARVFVVGNAIFRSPEGINVAVNAIRIALQRSGS